MALRISIVFGRWMLSMGDGWQMVDYAITAGMSYGSGIFLYLGHYNLNIFGFFLDGPCESSEIHGF